MEALARAIKFVGSQSALAERIGKKQAHIAMWLKRGRVPAEHCIPIERATDGEVTRYELRPDVFGEDTAKPKRRAA